MFLENLRYSEGLKREDVSDYKDFFFPDIFTQQYLEGLDLTPFQQANLLSIIGFVRNQEIARKYVIKRRGKNDFSQIKLVTFSSCITALGEHALVALLEKMQELGLLEIQKKFQVGVRSYGYRIGPELKNAKWRKREFNEVLEELILPQDSKLQPSKRSRTLHRCYNLWNRVQLFFTYIGLQTPEEEAFNTATLGHLKQLRLPDTPAFSKLIDDCARIKGQKNKEKGESLWYEDLKEIYLENVASINQLKHYITFDRITNRQFTRLSNLKSELRAELLYDGEKMVNCDFRTCQPALFASFYETSLGDQTEKEKFVRAIQNEEKDIYETIASVNMPRAEAKEAVFLIAFGEIRHQRGICYDNFRNLFPILTKRITINKKENYKAVSREMQTKEAKIMVSNILPTLTLKLGIPAFGIHDSVMCLPKDLDLVRTVMISAFEAEMGFSPLLKVS